MLFAPANLSLLSGKADKENRPHCQVDWGTCPEMQENLQNGTVPDCR